MGTERITKEIIREKSPELKDLSHQSEMGHQRISRNNFKSYVEVQTGKIFILKDKLKIPKVKKYLINKRANIELPYDFSSTGSASRQWSIVLRFLKENYLELRILFTAKPSFNV